MPADECTTVIGAPHWSLTAAGSTGMPLTRDTVLAIYSVAQRVTLLERGVSERSPRVRAAACAMLCHWLSDAYHDDVSALLRSLDVENHEGAPASLPHPKIA